MEDSREHGDVKKHLRMTDEANAHSATIRLNITGRPIRLKMNSLLVNPNWTWQDEMKAWVASIHRDQYQQYDPKHRSFCSYRSSLAAPMAPDLVKYFEQEATNTCGRPLDALTKDEIDQLDDESVNVHYVKIIESDVGFPLNLYGTVLGEKLNLLGPYRGPCADYSIDFEVNLKIRGDKGESTDIIFSKNFIEVNSDSGKTKRYFSSWLSTLELAYTFIHCAVQVAIGINILKGLSNFLGIISACGTESHGDTMLYDSELHGTKIGIGHDGSIALSRNVVVLRVDEMLILTISLYDDNKSMSSPIVLTVGHGDKSIDIGKGSYELRVKLDWSCIRGQD
uniref:DUF6598 domain-containing protein n=1 Tax=Leersia perrieri TaxID=77586 RepID=A0A0D9VYC8_9ORYZ